MTRNMRTLCRTHIVWLWRQAFGAGPHARVRCNASSCDRGEREVQIEGLAMQLPDKRQLLRRASQVEDIAAAAGLEVSGRWKCEEGESIKLAHRPLTNA
jgi:hypothetical protein